VRGTVYCEGSAVASGTVSFYAITADKKKPAKVADALLDADGSFVLTTYTANDGAPLGDYIVTITGSAVPEKYGKAETSDLRVSVKTGSNVLALDLKK
jgi:hypothetical protein